MGFKKVYVCDVCGKEAPPGSTYVGYNNDPPKPANWFQILHRQSVKVVCSHACLLNLPKPAPATPRKPAAKRPAKRAAKR